ncbi:MAG: GMC family oxidoreductase [Syntrophaceae bacterium]|nr:GMC family oxidoreductase [Syntrophaceae bacterium]
MKPASGQREEYDVIVVGSGVSGAAVARSVAAQGGRVLLLERGGRVNRMGNTLTVMRVLERCGLTRSREMNLVTFADSLGGASNLSAGCAMPPPLSVLSGFGIDLSIEAGEVRRELGIAELPDRLIGEANFRLMDAAASTGLPWRKMEKFIDPETCVEGCSDCMLGCRRGAKWTARAWVDDAVRSGADLKMGTRVDRVICEGGSAAGVEGKRHGRAVRYRGKAVVLSAGMSDVHLLRRAGIREAGKGFCCDWLQFVGGVVPGMSTYSAHPMAVGTTDLHESEGIIILPVFPNWSQFAVLIASKGFQHFTKLREFRNYTGIMVKVQDETEGEIYPGGSFSKPITLLDRKRLDKGVDLIRKVLRKAGAREDSILALNPIGAHPSASCRIGEVVDASLETRIQNLYCCDAGVLPRAMGAPLIWTLAALGKRLGTHLGRRLSLAAGSRAA